ncbi:hypothetical protein GCM10010254_49920 [Streptomyces chromofuscus]|nr:hypothetical protein GCM10010254_49920 [Streptomyces chromofuscus]
MDAVRLPGAIWCSNACRAAELSGGRTANLGLLRLGRRVRRRAALRHVHQPYVPVVGTPAVHGGYRGVRSVGEGAQTRPG